MNANQICVIQIYELRLIFKLNNFTFQTDQRIEITNFSPHISKHLWLWKLQQELADYNFTPNQYCVVESDDAAQPCWVTMLKRKLFISHYTRIELKMGQNNCRKMAKIIIAVFVAFHLTATLSIAICCESIKSLVDKKIESNTTLCAAGNTLPTAVKISLMMLKNILWHIKLSVRIK